MSESIKTVLKQLEKYYANPPKSEADTITKVILEILRAIGYSNDDFQQEYPVSSGKVDIAVLTEHSHAMWFIEAKAWEETLRDKEIEQTLSYVNTKGLRFAVLTNGKHWKLYDNKVQGQASDKLVRETELSADDSTSSL